MLKHKELTDQIIQSFYKVYNELGTGFLETIYENSLVIVLRERGLKVDQQKDLKVKFRDVIVGDYRTDLIIDDKIIIEIKAVSKLIKAHEAQLIHYLKATGIEVGIILNFGDSPEFKRMIFSKNKKGSA